MTNSPATSPSTHGIRGSPRRRHPAQLRSVLRPKRHHDDHHRRRGTRTIVRRVRITAGDVRTDTRSRRRRTINLGQLALVLGGDTDHCYAYSFIVTNAHRRRHAASKHGSGNEPTSKYASATPSGEWRYATSPRAMPPSTRCGCGPPCWRSTCRHGSKPSAASTPTAAPTANAYAASSSPPPPTSCTTPARPSCGSTPSPTPDRSPPPDDTSEPSHKRPLNGRVAADSSEVAPPSRPANIITTHTLTSTRPGTIAEARNGHHRPDPAPQAPPHPPRLRNNSRIWVRRRVRRR